MCGARPACPHRAGPCRHAGSVHANPLHRKLSRHWRAVQARRCNRPHGWALCPAWFPKVSSRPSSSLAHLFFDELLAPQAVLSLPSGDIPTASRALVGHALRKQRGRMKLHGGSSNMNKMNTNRTTQIIKRRAAPQTSTIFYDTPC